jgi:hypothetical protein
MQKEYLPDTFDGKLIHLIEECAEVTKCVTKIQRFGINNSHPRRLLTNREVLINEMKDLVASMNRVKKAMSKL